MNTFERQRRRLAERRKLERIEKQSVKRKRGKMEPEQNPAAGKVIDLDATLPKNATEEVAALVRAEIRLPQTPVPQAELDLLEDVALGNTGQSRSVRYLLFLLPGAADPTGFKGEGLLEMRPLDRRLAEAFLKVLDWWRGPTKSDQPLYDVLRKLEMQFAPGEPKE